MEPELLLGVITATIATALGVGASTIANQLANFVKEIRHRRPSYKKITFSEGKEEYIQVNVNDLDELRGKLDKYLEFEELVRKASKQALNLEVVVQYEAGKPDFIVNVNGKIVAIEAKTHLDPVSEGEINNLMSAQNASGIILVVPEDQKDKANKIRELADSDRFKLVTGSTLSALATAISAAVASLI